MRHLLAIERLSRGEIEAILDRAESFAEVAERDIKKVPTLRGRTVVSLFYESSTRSPSDPSTRHCIATTSDCVRSHRAR